MEVSLSSYNQYEFGADIFILPSPDTSYDTKDMEHVCSPPGGETAIWLRPTCNAPQREQDRISCDSYDECFHIDCVGIVVGLLKGRKGIILTVQVCFPPKNVAPG